MADTASDQLDAVNAAISAIVGGAQSVGVNGQTFTLASLSTLWTMKRALQAEIAAAQAVAEGRGPFVNITLARFK